MAYPTTAVFNPVPITNELGIQPILTTSTTQLHPLGLIVDAQDMGTAAMGVAKYIYLKGAASTAAGDAVVYTTGQTTQTTRLADDVIAGLVAVSMSANVAGPNYGWYGIQGVVPVAISGSPAYNLICYATSGAGAVSETVVTGDPINGMYTLSNASTGFAWVALAYPVCNQAVAT